MIHLHSSHTLFQSAGGEANDLQSGLELMQGNLQIMQGITGPLGLSAAHSKQRLPANLAHAHSLAVGKNDPALGSALAKDLPDLLHIHNRRPMYAGKFCWVQLS